MNLLSMLILTCSLLNSHLRLEVTKGEYFLELGDAGVNYFKKQNSINGEIGVKFYINHGRNID
jgi:hypothetical protein